MARKYKHNKNSKINAFRVRANNCFFFFCSKLANWILVRFEKSIKGPKRFIFTFCLGLHFGAVKWGEQIPEILIPFFNQLFEQCQMNHLAEMTERIGQGVGWIRARSTMTNVFNNFRRKMVPKIGTKKKSLWPSLLLSLMIKGK